MSEQIIKSFVPILEAIGTGIVAALLVGFIKHLLAKDRERTAGKENRKRDFLTFMRGWRKDAERMVLRYDAIYHFPGFFNDTIPGFCGFSETIRKDFVGNRRTKFESLISAISDSNWANCSHPDKYKEWLKSVDEFIEFVDTTHL